MIGITDGTVTATGIGITVTAAMTAMAVDSKSVLNYIADTFGFIIAISGSHGFILQPTGGGHCPAPVPL